MTISAEYIDQIVQNVMREMQTRVPMTIVPAPVANQQTATLETLSIGSRVVSENVLMTATLLAGRTISLQPVL